MEAKNVMTALKLNVEAVQELQWNEEGCMLTRIKLVEKIAH